MLRIGSFRSFCTLSETVSATVKDPLTDSFGRFHSYLRISLTEKCNLRCTYCMPEEGVPLSPQAKLLSTHEILRLTRLFASKGVDKVRLTGGEPSIRSDLVEIVHGIKEIGSIKDIGITSNGIVLKRKLKLLVEAGLNRLNLSLDTLDEHKYAIMTRRNGFKKVMECIDMAESLFERVKLNCVVIRGVNDDEVLKFVEFTEKRNLDIRFIEYMPFGGNLFESRKMVPFKELMLRISEKFDNRIVRLKNKPNDTSKVCLHGSAETSLRHLIRAGIDDLTLLEVISNAVLGKEAQHAGMDVLSHGKNRPMILIGG